jgi:hypothetical protein
MHVQPSSFTAVCALLFAACNGGQTGDESTPRPPDASSHDDAGLSDGEFFDALGRGTADRYLPADSIAELAERSERIAVGRIAAVREAGRLGCCVHELTVEFDVADLLQGPAANRLYIEFHAGPILDAARLPDPLPDNRLLVFVRPRYDDDDADGGAVPNTPGLPDGEVLQALTTPQGLVVETASGGLTISEPNLPFFVADDFEALLQQVRDAVE